MINEAQSILEAHKRLVAHRRWEFRIKIFATVVVALVIIVIFALECLFFGAVECFLSATETALGAAPAGFLSVFVPAVVWITSLLFLNFGRPIVLAEPEPWWKIGIRVLAAPNVAALVLFGDLCDLAVRVLERLKRSHPGLPRWLV